MKPRIVNLEDLFYRKMSHGERFEFQFGSVSTEVYSKKLGYNITVIPPGRCAFPYHAHRANEEMFFILEGRGSVRIVGKTH